MAKAQDIEDVLASIRQLVAEEAPAVMDRRSAPDDAGISRDRLVLGAEHRIVELVPEPAPDDAATADADPGADAPTMERWSDADAAPALPEAGRPAPELDPDAAPADAEDGAEDVAGFDPTDIDAMRALVADVVREELAGHLGERITRNVRKMVRREIRQIMSGEEFD